MKKLLAVVAVVAVIGVLAVCVSGALAAGGCRWGAACARQDACCRYADEDGDGQCDWCGQYGGWQHTGSGLGQGNQNGHGGRGGCRR